MLEGEKSLNFAPAPWTESGIDKSETWAATGVAQLGGVRYARVNEAS